jgi:hypothetical protein
MKRPPSQPGYLAPALLLLLAAASVGLLGARQATERVAEADVARVQAVLAELASAPRSEHKGQEGIYLVDGTQAPPWEFLRDLRYLRHPSRSPGPLDRASLDDKALADLYTAAQATGSGVIIRDAGPALRGARRLDDGAVLVVERPHTPSPGAPWGLLAAAVLLGFMAWTGVLRRFVGRPWAPALGAAGAALPLLGAVAWGVAQVEGAHLATDAALPTHRVAYAYVAPALVGMAVLVLVPFGLGLGLAFTTFHEGQFTFVGLSNFVEILGGGGRPFWAPLSFYFTLAVTLLWTLANITLHVGIGLGLALLLKDPDLRFKGLYRVLLVVPWAIPNYITALIWKGMFNKQFGAGQRGLPRRSWAWSRWAGFQLLAGLCHQPRHQHLAGLPLHDGGLLGALQSIPTDLYEAAVRRRRLAAGSASATSPCRCSCPRSCPQSSWGPSGPSTCSTSSTWSAAAPRRGHRHPHHRRLPLGLRARPLRLRGGLLHRHLLDLAGVHLHHQRITGPPKERSKRR